MHTKAGHAQARRDRAAERGTYHQRPDQARPRRVRHAVDVAPLNTPLGEHLINERQGFAHVVTTRKLWHHTAVLRMDLNLGVKRIRQEASLGVIQRHPGLITAGFDTQYPHSRYPFTSRRHSPSHPAHVAFP